MNKRLSLLTLPLFICISAYTPPHFDVDPIVPGPTVTDVYTYNCDVDYLIIGAVHLGATTQVYFGTSFDNRGLLTASNKIKIDKRNPLTGEFYNVYSKATKAMKIDDSFTDLEIFSYNEYKSAGMYGPQFRFEIESSKLSNTKYHATKIYTTYDERDPLNSYSDSDGVLTSDDNIYVYDARSGRVKNLSEKFHVYDEFENKIYEFDDQNYFKFDKKLITTSLDLPFDINITPKIIPTSSNIMLNDVNNYFPNLRKSSYNPVIRIYGNLINYDGGYGFEITDKLYIDPNTRLTYLNKTSDLILTKKLYFPSNASLIEVRSEEANRVFIFIEHAGLSHSRVILGADFSNFSNSLLGDCATSMYCVKSEPTNPDFEIGETISNND